MTKGVYDAAALETSTHLGTIQQYLSAYTTADTAFTTNDAANTAATAAVGASTAKLVGLTTAVSTASAAAGVVSAKISTQEAEITELGAAVARHATELGVLQATVTSKLADVTAAALAITNKTAEKTALIKLKDTQAYQSTPADVACVCTFAEPSTGAAWTWTCKTGGTTVCVPAYKGLTALKEAAITTFAGTSTADITDVALVGTGSSKKKASDDL